MGADLETAWDRPRLLIVDRDEEHIINSLAKRGWGWPLDTCTTVIRQMLIGREEFLRSTRCSFLRVEFDRLRREPRQVLAEITGFLDFVPTPERFARAVQFIRSG
ncbi:MAG: hypothetical protein KatS3mg111_0120 [Pirellulaceae bacterium]|nr:MAG: hypothetical protein KatS3mg111_0120 [Pirellulaceae bacterium]